MGNLRISVKTPRKRHFYKVFYKKWRQIRQIFAARPGSEKMLEFPVPLVWKSGQTRGDYRGETKGTPLILWLPNQLLLPEFSKLRLFNPFIKRTLGNVTGNISQISISNSGRYSELRKNWLGNQSVGDHFLNCIFPFAKFVYPNFTFFCCCKNARPNRIG